MAKAARPLAPVRHKTRKPRTRKYVSDETFAEIAQAFQEAIQHSRGERADLRTTKVELPASPKVINSTEIAKIRQRLNFSQAMFAKYLNVSKRTVQAWEQGIRIPSDAALKLLIVAKKHPEALMDAY